MLAVCNVLIPRAFFRLVICSNLCLFAGGIIWTLAGAGLGRGTRPYGQAGGILPSGLEDKLGTVGVR